MQPSIATTSGSIASDPILPVLMFTGQGSQKPGMGSDLMDIPLVVDTFECASDIYGFDVARVAFEGPGEVLNETKYAQAAILTLSLALTRYLQAEGVKASAVLGFSLGQISALYASEMLGMEDTFALARVRASAMEQAAHDRPGLMCALLGADRATAAHLCEASACGDILVVANYNCPGQVVVSGGEGAVRRVQSAWCEQGGKTVLLATSGAFHSPLMSDAAGKLSAFCKTLVFSPPKTPLICNTDAQPFREGEAAERLANHLVRPVLFQQSVELLLEKGAESFVEVGYGSTLVGFVKRIDSKVRRYCIDTAEKLTDYLSSQGGTHG